MMAIRTYLMDPESEEIDMMGNSLLHLQASNDEMGLHETDLHS
jgi:hypothetical protein